MSQHLCPYGEDFPGSDVRESLTFAGVRTILLLDPFLPSPVLRPTPYRTGPGSKRDFEPEHVLESVMKTFGKA